MAARRTDAMSSLVKSCLRGLASGRSLRCVGMSPWEARLRLVFDALVCEGSRLPPSPSGVHD